MSNAQRKGKRKSAHTDARYQANKAKRIERDAKRAKPMECGHGSRHKHPDGLCRRCYAARRGT